MNHRILLTLLLSSCVEDPATGTSVESLTSPGSCVVVGAIPNDGIDDRIAIQMAETFQGCADLPSGQFDIHVNLNSNGGRVYGGSTGLDRFDMIRLTGGRSLRGSGPATVLKFWGDATRSDIRGVGLIGDENLVENLTLDTTGWTNTGEQSHAIHITGPSLRNKVSGVVFHHPSLGPSAGGDCIKVVGYDPTYDANGTVLTDKRVSFIATGNVFAQCDRSGITMHSGVLDAVISSNLFLATGDQDIDGEGGGGAIENLTVANNVFRRALNNGTSVALGNSLTRKATLVGNVFEGGNFATTATEKEVVNTYNVERLTVAGNTFQSRATALRMIKMSQQVVISGNTFRVLDDTGPACAIVATHHNSGKPGSFVISGNQFSTVSTNGCIVNMISARDLTFSGNGIQWTPVNPPAVGAQNSAIVAYGITQPTDMISVTGNTVKGPYPHVLFVANSYLNYSCPLCGGYRSVTFGGNVMRGPLVGLRCTNPLPDEPVVSYGNSGAPNQCAAVSSGN